MGNIFGKGKVLTEKKSRSDEVMVSDSSDDVRD